MVVSGTRNEEPSEGFTLFQIPFLPQFVSNGRPPQNVQKGQGSTLPRGIVLLLVSVTKRWRAVRHAQTSVQRREQRFARYFYVRSFSTQCDFLV